MKDLESRRELRTIPGYGTKQSLRAAIKKGAVIKVMAKGGGDVSQKFVEVSVGKGRMNVELSSQNNIVREVT